MVSSAVLDYDSEAGGQKGGIKRLNAKGDEKG
jgi:hypothetical protein